MDERPRNTAAYGWRCGERLRSPGLSTRHVNSHRSPPRNENEEEGFADAIARLLIIAWRAIYAREGEGFAKIFDPTLALWCSLQQRVEVMEAHFKSLNITPWRTMQQVQGSA